MDRLQSTCEFKYYSVLVVLIIERMINTSCSWWHLWNSRASIRVLLGSMLFDSTTFRFSYFHFELSSLVALIGVQYICIYVWMDTCIDESTFFFMLQM